MPQHIRDFLLVAEQVVAGDRAAAPRARSAVAPDRYHHRGIARRRAARGYRSLLSLLFGTALRETVDVAGTTPERAETITGWFRRNVSPEDLPSLHWTLPALMDAECLPDLADELDLLIAGLRTR
jgi:hypothetical protein